MKQSIESRSQAYKRITDGIRQFVNHSVGAAKLVLEAKRTEIWKEKWSSWQEYCEKEFGKSRQRVYELLEVAGTIDEIKSVIFSDAKVSAMADIESGKNKEILDNLNRRQVAELKGLSPVTKAEVLAKAISVEGGKSPKPATLATARKACGEFGDGTYRGHSMASFYVKQKDDIDPADKIPKSTPEDVAAAVEVSEVYPKKITFEVLTREEEVPFRVLIEETLVKRGNKNGHTKLDIRGAIASVCNAYKKATNKTFAVKPMDAGQLRRLLESGITLDEFIQTAEKAWKSDSFLARYSHQLASFVKHYGNIRNEVTSSHRNSVKPGTDRNAGTANANRIGQYDGVGKVV